MTSISKILSQLPNLEITGELHDSQKLEIEFRAGSEWLAILENIAPMFPDLYFCKRYFSEGGKFGFRWCIIKFGSVPEEYIEELASKFNFALFENSKPMHKSKPKVDVRAKSQKDLTVITKQTDDGTVTYFPIPHLKGEMNAPTGNGRGAYTKAKEIQNAWGGTSGGSWG